MVNILGKKFTLTGLELKMLGMAAQDYRRILEGTLAHSLSGNTYDSFRKFYAPVLKKVQEIDYFKNILDNFEKELKERYDITS